MSELNTNSQNTNGSGESHGAVAELDVEGAVHERYTGGAQEMEPQLCCPVDYDPKFLKILPAEIIERDYGCGDPSAYVNEGERVLDLGSGGGKICYILSQKVGASGSVVGVDMNDTMLALANKYRDELAEKIGWGNVEFKKGKIQDLRTDLDAVEAHLAEHPVNDLESYGALDRFANDQKVSQPLIAEGSVDVVVSNCVLNLVRAEDKSVLFEEIFRVLARGGRAVISDIVADEPIPESMRNDPDLWSGCISGAFLESEFLGAFEQAGFHGIEILEWQSEPWRTIHGIEFRSVTLVAYKGKQGPCMEGKQAVVYKGPFKFAEDDDGHRYPRGQRVAVCEKTFGILRKGSYAESFVFLDPLEAIQDAEPFDCSRTVLRHPRESKGMDYDVTTEAADDCCAPGSDCC